MHLAAHDYRMWSTAPAERQIGQVADFDDLEGEKKFIEKFYGNSEILKKLKDFVSGDFP